MKTPTPEELASIIGFLESQEILWLAISQAVICESPNEPNHNGVSNAAHAKKFRQAIKAIQSLSQGHNQERKQ